MGKDVKRRCQRCGKVFVITRWWKIYCSPDCRWKDWDKKHPRRGMGRK